MLLFHVNRPIWLQTLCDLHSRPKADPLEAQFKEKRANELFIELGLNENTKLAGNSDTKHCFWEALYHYGSVFSTSDSDIGATTDTEFEIKLKEGAQPVKQQACPLHPRMMAGLENQVRKWLEANIIEVSVSAWASPLVPVKTKDGTIWWAVDYCRLNSVTMGDSYPSRSPNELLDRLTPSDCFSTLDVCQAYHVIKVAEQSKHVTAFTSPLGLYQFKCMAFGLLNAGARYLHFSEGFEQKIGSKNLLSYVDDSMVITMGINEHITVLIRAIKVFFEAGLKMKAKKCHLLKDSVTFLGHEVSTDGVKPVEDKLEVI